DRVDQVLGGCIELGQQVDGVLERLAALELPAELLEPVDLLLEGHAVDARAIAARIPFTSRPASSDEYRFASVTASSITTSSGTVPSSSSWMPMRRTFRSRVPSCPAGQSPETAEIRASSSSAFAATASARLRAKSSISP